VGHLELDPLVLVKVLEPGALDRRVVDEHVRALAIRGNEAEALLTVEPLDSSLRSDQLVHVDVKKMGKIPESGGWKAHGRQIGKTSQQRKARIGYDYVHSMVDDHSRLGYSEILPDEKGETCAGFITRAAAYFAENGIANIERVLTDNHWSYRKSLDVGEAIKGIGARHTFIKPHCPCQNGKVERYNRTIQVEWAYATVYLNNAHRAAALAPWIEYYNTQRRHTARKGKPPTSLLSPM